AEARARALARVLVRRREHDRVDVVHGHAGRVLADAAVLVVDLALHRADAVVGRGAGGRGGPAVGAVARAAVERVLEARARVGAGGVARAREEEVEVRAFADRAVVREG